MLQGKTMRDVSEDFCVAHCSAKQWHADDERACLRDLIEVLLPYPDGLRRWSIMRTIRSRREKGGEQISLKLEDEVERVFRKFCPGERLPKSAKFAGSPEDGLFHRPKERAGEVWAVNPQRARAWLTMESGAEFDAR